MRGEARLLFNLSKIHQPGDYCDTKGDESGANICVGRKWSAERWEANGSWGRKAFKRLDGNREIRCVESRCRASCDIHLVSLSWSGEGWREGQQKGYLGIRREVDRSRGQSCSGESFCGRGQGNCNVSRESGQAGKRNIRGGGLALNYGHRCRTSGKTEVWKIDPSRDHILVLAAVAKNNCIAGKPIVCPDNMNPDRSGSYLDIVANKRLVVVGSI